MTAKTPAATETKSIPGCWVSATLTRHLFPNISNMPCTPTTTTTTTTTRTDSGVWLHCGRWPQEQKGTNAGPRHRFPKAFQDSASLRRLAAGLCCILCRVGAASTQLGQCFICRLAVVYLAPRCFRPFSAILATFGCFPERGRASIQCSALEPSKLRTQTHLKLSPSSSLILRTVQRPANSTPGFGAQRTPETAETCAMPEPKRKKRDASRPWSGLAHDAPRRRP